ncbi:ABC transporter substrate-binding protein [Streptomyces sp. NPDC003042]
MTTEPAWEFRDDRGHLAAAPKRPSRVVAYLQAGAALWDHGIRPVGVFGSTHDGAVPDPVKADALPLRSTPYLGAGAGLDVNALLGAGPELVVAVSYGGGDVYGIDPDAAKYLGERVPLVVLDVGGGRALAGIRARFTALARHLGAPDRPELDDELARSERRLREAAASGPRRRVLALSPAGPDTVHLARARTWPDLAALAELGVAFPEPAEGPGVNWASTSWAQAASMKPDLLLVDARAHAAPLGEALGRGTPTVPWNPELPPSVSAYLRFATRVTEALATWSAG